MLKFKNLKKRNKYYIIENNYTHSKNYSLAGLPIFEKKNRKKK